jgi:uncharacterized protein (DUF58 family)
MEHATDVTLGSPRELAAQDFEMVIRRMANDIALGADASVFVGSGLEYACSRPYQPGDAVRALNWRLSGRQGRPFVKQYDVLRRVSAHIVVDTSASMAVSSRALSKLDYALWAAAAIGLVCLRRMSPVALAGHALGSPPRPSLRRADFWLSLDRLRACTPQRGQVLEAMDYIVLSENATGMVVVLSDFYEPAVTQALIRCALRHDCIAIRLTDPAELGGLRAGFFAGCEAETGRAFTGTRGVRWADNAGVGDDLLAAGVDILDVRTDVPPAESVRRFLASRGSLARSCR